MLCIKSYSLLVLVCSSTHFLFMLYCDWTAVVAMTTSKQILPDHLVDVAQMRVEVIATQKCLATKVTYCSAICQKKEWKELLLLSKTSFKLLSLQHFLINPKWYAKQKDITRGSSVFILWWPSLSEQTLVTCLGFLSGRHYALNWGPPVNLPTFAPRSHSYRLTEIYFFHS